MLNADEVKNKHNTAGLAFQEDLYLHVSNEVDKRISRPRRSRGGSGEAAAAPSFPPTIRRCRRRHAGKALSDGRPLVAPHLPVERTVWSIREYD